MKQLTKSKEIWILLMLIVLSVLISSNSNVFLRPDNLLDLLKNNAVLGILALGMTLIIITGGIDVSVGAIVAALTVLIGKFMVTFGGNLLVIFLIAISGGIIIGIINGTLVARANIPAIVVTLGTMSIINGLMLYYTNGTWINGIPMWFIDFGKITLFKFSDASGNIVGFPIQIVILLLMVLLTWALLKYTLIGRAVYAVGGNPVSARRVGINIERTLIFVYAYMGFLAGVAAVVHTSIMRQVDPNAFLGFEMQVIAAVVVGGANIMGGSGSVLGTLLGVLFLAVLNNGLILMHIPTFWQKIIVSLIIIFAVSFDVMQKKRIEKSLPKVDIEN
ncbi:ABC transporter permease [Neomoorella thermoacetica]|uniref:ABC transporter permease n=1 Tax=Neomoorella thermoacetica TaxID=1525 RepID=UPI0008FB346D|nr:ABC transporter permease [Moorella thermoacetica]APC09200.1 ribose transport system permease protein RbsC [Moorella thermoacetica]